MATTFTYEDADITTLTPTAYTYHSYVANIYSIAQLNAEMANTIGGTGVCAYSVDGGAKTELNVPDRKLYTDIVYVEDVEGLEKNVYTADNAPTVSCLKDVNIQDFYIDVTLTENDMVTIDGVNYYSEIYFTFRDRETKASLENAPNLVLRTYDSYTGKYIFRQLPVLPNRQADVTAAFFGENSYTLYPSAFINMNNPYGQSSFPTDNVDYFPTIPAIPFVSDVFEWSDYTNYVFPYAEGLAMRFYSGDRYLSNRAFKPNYSKEEILRFVAVLGLYFEFEGTMYLGYMDSTGQTTGDYLTADEWSKSAQWDSTSINNFKEHTTPVTPPEPSQKDRYDDIGLTINGNGQSFLKNYAVTGAELTDFLAWCNSENVPEGMNPMEYVVAVTQAPCSMSGLISAGSESTIYVGRENTGVSAFLLGNQATYSTTTIGTFDIPNYHDNFLNYEPYTHIDLYIPYCGTVSLPPSLFCGSALKVDLIYDIFSGECAGVVYCNGKYYTSISGNFMTMQPISTENTGAIKQAVINGAIGVIGGAGGAIASLATGNVIGGVIGAGAMFTSAYKSMVGMNSIAPSASAGGGGRCNFYKPNKCILYITSPDNRTTSDFYKVNGGVVNAQRNIAKGDGFTQISVPVVNGNMTLSEKAEIENYMKSGIIL